VIFCLDLTGHLQ